jgi:ankyrin repeat protein
MKKWIDRGANVNAADPRWGITPLIAAVLSGNKEAVEILINKGADVNGATAGGITPLMAAGLNTQNLDIAKLLIAKGADVKKKTKAGMTALAYATFLDKSLVKFAKAAPEGKSGLVPKSLGTPATNPMAELLKKHGAE